MVNTRKIDCILQMFNFSLWTWELFLCYLVWDGLAMHSKRAAECGRLYISHTKGVGSAQVCASLDPNTAHSDDRVSKEQIIYFSKLVF